jgi:hypothetical protein
MDWYASENNLRRSLRDSWKKLNVGRSPTCCLWMANANSHMPCHALRSRFQNGMVVARHGRSMARVNQTWPHCVNQMGQVKPVPGLNWSRGWIVIALPFRDLCTRRGWVVTTTPRPLYPWERPRTHCAGGWVGARAGLDVYEKSRPHQDLIPGPSSP